jgi:hypothetical protein
VIGVALNSEERRSLTKLSESVPQFAEAIQRLLSKSPLARPPAEDIEAWLTLIGDARGDPLAGQRIFFGSKIGTCSRCHQIEGRGHSIGPDLSIISQRLATAGEDHRRWLLKSVLLPSQDIAPQFTPWRIVTTDGKVLTGLPRRKGGNAEAYLGLDGKEFVLQQDQIEFRQELTTSIMPKELLNSLTIPELRDLIAFLIAPHHNGLTLAGGKNQQEQTPENSLNGKP